MEFRRFGLKNGKNNPQAFKKIISKKKAWLLFAEDPGAWKFFLPLAKELKKINQNHSLILSGKAAELARSQKVSFNKLNQGMLKRKNLFFTKAIIGTSENKKSQGFKLIQWCKNNKIPSIGLVDSTMNAKYRFRGTSNNPLKFMPDNVVVPEIRTKKEFIQLGFPKNKIKVIKAQLLKKILLFSPKTTKTKKIQIKVPRDHFVVTFASEPSTGVDPSALIKSKSYSFKGRGNSKKRTVIAIQEFLDSLKKLECKTRKRLFCILRLHPKESRFHLKNIKKEFNYVSQKETSSDILRISNLVVGMTSMFLQEACAHRIPVISIAVQEEEKKWLPQYISKKIYVVSSKRNLVKKIKKILRKKNKEMSLKIPNNFKTYVRLFLKI